jgi:glutamate carboxypeptidase
LAAAGLPTVDTLGPRGGELHSPREYVLLDSLTERAKLAALFLMKLANGAA